MKACSHLRVNVENWKQFKFIMLLFGTNSFSYNYIYNKKLYCKRPPYFFAYCFFSPLGNLSFATYKDHIKLSGQPGIDIRCSYVPAVRYLSRIYHNRLLTERNFVNVMLCRGHITKEREKLRSSLALTGSEWTAVTLTHTYAHTHSLTCSFSWALMSGLCVFYVLRYWDKGPVICPDSWLSYFNFNHLCKSVELLILNIITISKIS